MLYRAAIAPPTGQRTGRASIASSLCAPSGRRCARARPSPLVRVNAAGNAGRLAGNRVEFAPVFVPEPGHCPTTSAVEWGVSRVGHRQPQAAARAERPPSILRTTRRARRGRMHARVSTPDAPQNAALSGPGAAADRLRRTLSRARTHGNGGDDAPCGRLAEAGAERHLSVHAHPQSGPCPARRRVYTADRRRRRLQAFRRATAGDTSADPGGETTRTASPRIGPAYTITPLPMAHATAGAPCTTRRSPNGIALPGALVAAGRTVVISRITRQPQHGAQT